MEAAIRIRDLRFTWPGSPTPCLTLASLDVPRGERLFIQGDSGAGKSTLLNLIGGVMPADTGQLEVLGQPLDRLNPHARDRFRVDHTGFIFQQFNLIPYLSVLDNVLLPCRFSPLRAHRAGDPAASARTLLAALEISGELLARPAHALSVGQQQRVAAARALIGGPEILIADEPTSALDAGRQSAFVELLLAQARQHRSSVVFVSHDLRLASCFTAVRELPS